VVLFAFVILKAMQITQASFRRKPESISFSVHWGLRQWTPAFAGVTEDLACASVPGNLDVR
jgi:hypothetical protein